MLHALPNSFQAFDTIFKRHSSSAYIKWNSPKWRLHRPVFFHCRSQLPTVKQKH